MSQDERVIPQNMDPYKLDAYLYQIADIDLPTWYALLKQSYAYRQQAQTQHNLYYFQRQFWEYGVKLAITSLGLTSLALGSNALVVLSATGLVLGLSHLIFNAYTKIKHPTFKPVKLENKPQESRKLLALKSHWFLGREQHRLQEQQKRRQENVAKTAMTTTLGLFLFFMCSTQAGLAFALIGLGFLSTLMLEANKEMPIYLEDTMAQPSI